MKIPFLSRNVLIAITAITAALLLFNLPLIRYTLNPPADSGLTVETLRIFSHDCKTQRGGDLLVEIADDDAKRNTGLQNRLYLPSDRGMLFLWPGEAVRSMWMRDTPISLDMLFIRADGTIANVGRWRRPNTDRITNSTLPARAVLEIRGGLARKIGAAGGDRILHRAFPTPPGNCRNI